MAEAAVATEFSDLQIVCFLNESRADVQLEALHMRSSDFNPVLDPDPATMATPIDIAATIATVLLSLGS